DRATTALRMEHRWSPAGAISGNRSQMGRRRKRLIAPVWGQVLGTGSRSLGVAQGGSTGMRRAGKTAWLQEKTKPEAALLRLADALRILHGKEGVDGSSPSEGSAKAPHVGAFSYVFSRCTALRAWMEPFM